MPSRVRRHGVEEIVSGVEGIVTLLDAAWTRSVAATWHTIDRTLGLRGVLITPYPHFSYLVGGRIDREALASRLTELTQETAPFTVRVRGIATFAEPWPVVYLRIVPSARLRELHRAVWERARPLVQGPIAYYLPGRWVPHITLAHGDELGRLPLSSADVAAVKGLVPRGLAEGTVRVDNLTFIVEENGRQVLGRRFVLEGPLDASGHRYGTFQSSSARRRRRPPRRSPPSEGRPRHRAARR